MIFHYNNIFLYLEYTCVIFYTHNCNLGICTFILKIIKKLIIIIIIYVKRAIPYSIILNVLIKDEEEKSCMVS